MCWQHVRYVICGLDKEQMAISDRYEVKLIDIDSVAEMHPVPTNDDDDYNENDINNDNKNVAQEDINKQQQERKKKLIERFRLGYGQSCQVCYAQ